MVSVIIPLYNKVATIGRAIESVLGQSVRDYELIVVDNDSDDGSIEAVNAFDDNRIRVVRENRRGVSFARNRGVAEARGEWVTFLDADDEWLPDFLACCLRMTTLFPQCQVLATGYSRCDILGRIHNIRLNGVDADSCFLMRNYFVVASQSDPPFCSISVMIRKEALLCVGCFPTDVHQGEDLLTWARLAARHPIAYHKSALAVFHAGETSGMDRPRRTPDPDDPVGKGLEQLNNDNPGIPGLTDYIALWHKMRASIYMRLPGCSRQCRSEIRLARQWHRHSKLHIYYILTLLPYRLRMALLRNTQ